MFGKKNLNETENAPSNPLPADASIQNKADIAQQAASQDAASQNLPAVTEKSSSDLQKSRQTVDLVDLEKSIKDSDNVYKVKQSAAYSDASLITPAFKESKAVLLDKLVAQIDFVAMGKMEAARQRVRVTELIEKIMSGMAAPLNSRQLDVLKEQVLHELFGFGPIEPLLEDNDISDIMINGPYKIFVEKKGKVYLTDVKFDDDRHLINVIQRIVSRVGRRVDEASPMVDARMPDGSRFNAIIPPLALDGALVSIRKFQKNKMPLTAYVQHGSMSPEMVKFLGICSRIRLNMIVSGGTGSGKTTLLNALSGFIGEEERIITIEDAAELQFQQPHVLRLETRPPSADGKGEINQRQLVKNALRMRPDRIILGEIRGDEVIDVLSAMNTGHDGSMATIHANNPRDCLARLENLVGMSSVNIGMKSLRHQITSAIQLIIQIERMRDGKRRITSVEEIIGMEGDVITTQTLFSFKPKSMNSNGELEGEFVCHGIRPKMLSRAEYYGKTREVLECFNVSM